MNYENIVGITILLEEVKLMQQLKHECDNIASLATSCYFLAGDNMSLIVYDNRTYAWQFESLSQHKRSLINNSSNHRYWDANT